MNTLQFLSAASLAASIPVLGAVLLNDGPAEGSNSPVNMVSASAFDTFVPEPKTDEVAPQSFAKDVLTDGITEVDLASGPLLEGAPIIAVSTSGPGLPLPAAAANAPQPLVAGVSPLQQGSGPATVSQRSAQSVQSSSSQPGFSTPPQSGGSGTLISAPSAPATPAIAAVPLPAGGLLLLTALGGAIAMRRRAKR